ncbi:MAG TPA: acetoacetate decarboxylase family protein [Myxococcota bacterium]|jgi:hypothetical protein
MAATPGAPIHRIQGREVRMPVVVRRATSGSATFLVSSAAARRLIRGEGLDVAEVLPGRALCSLALIDYADNDLGDYHEVSIALFVRPGGGSGPRFWLRNAIDMARGKLGTHIVHLPVDQAFTCEAGRAIWGFPKTVQKIDFEYRPKRLTCKLVMDGVLALTLTLPRGGTRVMPDTDLATYTFIEGVLHRTAFRSGADGFGAKLGGAELTLGAGPIASELRSLGLPRRALLTTWMERMHGSFESAEKL